jgi:hypothetical protein
MGFSFGRERTPTMSPRPRVTTRPSVSYAPGLPNVLDGYQTMNRSISISLLIVAALLPSCGKSDQDKAVEQPAQIHSALKDLRPGTIATSADGYAMKAKLNRKNWVAATMMPQDAAGRIVGYLNYECIGRPYDRRYLVVGKTVKFGDSQAVDLATNDEVGL